ncbi:enoyl-CoA hydratase/isomerase family protein [Gemmobacter sp.]|uniref:enoyl-CoA hydratase/isomerase family protein n=1 Tax=Gemmobacter sp. TaxID=1898957 RepID=UPI002AFF0893|nr:enoyl-CoA hydratase-related protein [Gemmobacter sp.]
MAIVFTKKNNVATIMLNRPEAMNSLDPETMKELTDAFHDCQMDNSVRVVILTAAGERAFCAGADLKKTLAVQHSFVEGEFGRGEEESELRIGTEKPVICAINGIAVGGGLELALCADIRIASDKARFGLTEARIGSMPGGGGTQLLPRQIGYSNAMYMMLTAEIIPADEALRLGLVAKIVPHENLLAEAEAIAEKIAGNAPLSVRAIKKVAKDGLDLPLASGLRLERYTWGLIRGTEDRDEGRRAFAEKRKPDYKGR